MFLLLFLSPPCPLSCKYENIASIRDHLNRHAQSAGMLKSPVVAERTLINRRTNGIMASPVFISHPGIVDITMSGLHHDLINQNSLLTKRYEHAFSWPFSDFMHTP